VKGKISEEGSEGAEVRAFQEKKITKRITSTGSDWKLCRVGGKRKQQGMLGTSGGGFAGEGGTDKENDSGERGSDFRLITGSGENKDILEKRVNRGLTAERKK